MKPAPGEFAPFYESYVSLVRASDVISALKEAADETIPVLRSLPAELWRSAYAPGKWKVSELAVHIIDSERVFAYRALRFGRGDNTELPGYDHDLYVPASKANDRDAAGIINEMESVREATLTLFKSFDREALERSGIANGKKISVNALGFVIAGHQLHHLNILRTKYLAMAF